MYKWNNPHEWLEDYIPRMIVPRLRQTIRDLASLLDNDQLQDLFEKEMDMDGYFDEGESDADL